MSQLRIDYANNSTTSNDNSATNDAPAPRRSRNFVLLPGNFSACSLTKKMRQLRRVRPSLAAVIEGLVDDALREARGRKL